MVHHGYLLKIMPIPQPEPNEQENEFISRCIAELVGNEGKPQDQAAAICYQQLTVDLIKTKGYRKLVKK
jgi:hypothetical protein